ncbi:MAG: alpha-1,3-galactosidase B [Porphyromonas sp.]|nr:alpha-1,3-galactosidase B [Porphyromonas sp.]
MKKILSLLVALMLFGFTGCADRQGSVTLTLTDYGAVTDHPEEDNTPALLSALKDAKAAIDAGKDVVLQLPEGQLHLYTDQMPTHQIYISNHDHVDRRPVAFMLDGYKNLTIQGSDTHLLFHGRLIPFVIQNSSNVKLEGFSIDNFRPAMTQIDILEIDESKDEVLVKLLDETVYRIDDNRKLIVEGEDFEINVYTCLAFGADEHMKWGRSDPLFNPKAIEVVDDHRLLLKGWQEIKHLEVGDHYALRSYYRPTPAIVIADAADTEIQNVDVHYAEGMGLVAQNSTNITLNNFTVSRRERSPRRFTTVADATHFSGCRGVIDSTEGLYENMADDAINVHGTYLRVDSIIAPDQLMVSFAHGQTFGISWYETGDSLALISRETLLPVARFMPTQVEVLSPKNLKITVDGTLAAIEGETQDLLAVENLTAHPEVYFANNTVRNNRARGALFSTPKRVDCLDNLFDHTHGCAILLTGDANGWYESGPCEEVLIKGNRFINALTGLYQFTDGIISVNPQIARMEEGQYFHGSVIVENNEFDTFPTPLVYAKSLRALTFKDNVINTNNDYPSHFKDNNPQLINVGTVTGTLPTYTEE